jgi:putative transposase
MYKAYKYRVYPTADQKVSIEKHFGCARFVYNWGLETKIKVYKETGKSPTFFGLCKMLTQLKNDNIWLKDTYLHTLQVSLMNLNTAYTNFFRDKKGFPKFKSKHTSKQSCQFPDGVKVDFEKNITKLPKIGKVKTVFSRGFVGNIKTCTLSKTSTGKYFVSIMVETPEEPKQKFPVSNETAVGIDLGIKHFCVLSTGEKIDNPRFLKTNLDRLKVLQRRASKKKKGSTRRHRANKKVSLKHEYISNCRKDFLHKLSTKLIRENQTICLEDLNVDGMIKNRKLSQCISDVGWSQFVDYLKYKAEWYGNNILQVDRFFPSSKTCSSCGEIKKDLTLKDREWTCRCGVTHDRDVNAALNIFRAGLAR